MNIQPNTVKGINIQVKLKAVFFKGKNHSKTYKKCKIWPKPVKFWPKMAKNWTFLKVGPPTDEFQAKFSGFSIQFGYRNCKTPKIFRLES